MAVAAPGSESTPLIPRATPRRVSRARAQLPVGVVGLVLVVAGAVLQLVAFLSATWVDGTNGAPKAPTVIHDFGWFSAQTQRGFAFIYFAWGGWVLFVLALGFGVAACIRWRWAPTFRVVGALFGVVAAVMTIAGVLVFAYQTDNELFHIARNYAVGVYLAVLGLLATAFGAAAGVRP